MDSTIFSYLKDKVIVIDNGIVKIDVITPTGIIGFNSAHSSVNLTFGELVKKMIMVPNQNDEALLNKIKSTHPEYFI